MCLCLCVCRKKKSLVVGSIFLFSLSLNWQIMSCRSYFTPGQPEIHSVSTQTTLLLGFWSYFLALDHMLLLTTRLKNITARRIARKWSVCFLHLPPLLRDGIIWLSHQPFRINFDRRKERLKCSQFSGAKHQILPVPEQYWASAIFFWGQDPNFQKAIEPHAVPCHTNCLISKSL